MNNPRNSNRRSTGPRQGAVSRGGAARPASRGARGPRSGGMDAAPPSIAGVRIDQVQNVLGEILQWAWPADATLSRWLRAHRELGSRDRAEVAEAVFDVLRNLRRYRQFGESGVGPASRRLAVLGLAATLGRAELEPGLAPAEADWLDHVANIDPASLPRAVRESLPDWLDERLGGLEDADALIEALNQQAPLDIRVNPMKADRDEVLAAMQNGPESRYLPQASAYSPWGIRLQGRPAVNRWPLFESGGIEVQDEGSQLLALLVAPRRGEMVIDFCAGAGGKTLLLGALMRSTGRLYAFDVSAARLTRAKPRFARSGLSNVVPVVIDGENDTRVKRLAGKAQRVLVDAPCSGIGTLRRNPDLKWRQHPDALAELCTLQSRILSSAARCVAPGGRLVYATCSLLPEENEAQAEIFLASHPDFERVDAAALLTARCDGLILAGPYVQLRPDVHGTDGFFAAVFERRKTPARAAEEEAEAVVKAAAALDAGEASTVGEEAGEEVEKVQVPEAGQPPAGKD
ncbi:rRNA methyltransferase [Bordetella genomosp. 10]|uniref:rRNA methyltransferase n=1 Tax=Bordetella genomosp. 10 TaxID=1416804 RepID=A0A261S9P4_9BORD|nr:rRNA methyltransferase [Bordetella genomosp. 10]